MFYFYMSSIHSLGIVNVNVKGHLYIELGSRHCIAYSYNVYGKNSQDPRRQTVLDLSEISWTWGVQSTKKNEKR